MSSRLNPKEFNALSSSADPVKNAAMEGRFLGVLLARGPKRPLGVRIGITAFVAIFLLIPGFLKAASLFYGAESLNPLLLDISFAILLLGLGSIVLWRTWR